MLNERNRQNDNRTAIHRSLLRRLTILVLLMLGFAVLAQTLSPSRETDESAAEQTTETADTGEEAALSGNNEQSQLPPAAGDDELELLQDDPLSDETSEDALAGEDALSDETDPLAEPDDELLAEGELDPNLEMDASMEKFVPTEKISEDRSVSFPNDI